MQVNWALSMMTGMLSYCELWPLQSNYNCPCHTMHERILHSFSSFHWFGIDLWQNTENIYWQNFKNILICKETDHITTPLVSCENLERILLSKGKLWMDYSQFRPWKIPPSYYYFLRTWNKKYSKAFLPPREREKIWIVGVFFENSLKIVNNQNKTLGQEKLQETGDIFCLF